MRPETNSANTKTWLEASRTTKIRAYIQNYMPTLSAYKNPFPEADLYEKLREASVTVQIQPFGIIRTSTWDGASGVG